MPCRPSEARPTGTAISKTTEQQRVVVQGPDIVIQPATPEVIYVPTYQPAVVYGSYWNYPSYYYPGVWAPWPGYSFVNGFAWGIGFGIGNILFGGCDWGHHDVWMDYGVINNCPIYHNTPYYNGGHWGGGHGHQPWVHNADYAHLTRGGAGAPYGGRDNGRVRGITSEPAALARRGTDRAAGPGYLGPPQRNATNRSDRGVNRTAANGSPGTMARGGNRPAAHGPAGYSGRRTEPAAVRGTRPTVNGSTARPDRGVNRAAAHGPAGYRDNGINRPAMNGSTGRPERGVNRPAVHGPTGYAGQGYNRPAANGSTRYRGQGVNRPATNGSTGYSERGYNRPASRPQTGLLAAGSRPILLSSCGASPDELRAAQFRSILLSPGRQGLRGPCLRRARRWRRPRGRRTPRWTEGARPPLKYSFRRLKKPGARCDAPRSSSFQPR